MNKEKAAQSFYQRAVCFLILAILFAFIGFYKILVYENSEYSWESNKNSYVNGDAYNYIINGTYFTGFCALSGACFISACIYSSARLKIDLEYAEEVAKQQTGQESVDVPDLGREKEAEEAARKARIINYWNTHLEEFKALSEKQEDAKRQLNEIGGLSKEQRKVLEDLVQSIDEEFVKDREP